MSGRFSLRRSWALWLGWGWIGCILYASLMPSPPPLPGQGSDKLVHLLAYALPACWFAWLYPGRRALWVALLLIALGAVIEWLQPRLSARYFEWADMGANTLGVLLGIILARSPLRRLAVYLGLDVRR